MSVQWCSLGFILILEISSCSTDFHIFTYYLQQNPTHPNVRRLIMGETTLINNRTLICMICPESFAYEVEIAYYDSDKHGAPKETNQADQCLGAKQFLTIDMTRVINRAEFLTYMRISIYFYQGESRYGYFGFRLITTDIPVSLKLDANECRKSHTSLLVCSITLPHKSSLFAVIDSITWSYNGKTIENDSKLIVPRENEWSIATDALLFFEGNQLKT